MIRIIAKLMMVVAAAPAAAEYWAVPALIRLQGLNPVLGAAAGARRLHGERLGVVAGAGFGGIQGQGVALLDLPLFSSHLGLNAGFANVQKARFASRFSRGLNQGTRYDQDVSAVAYGAEIATHDLGGFKAGLGYVLSTVKLRDFYHDGNAVQLPDRGGLHDVETTSMTARFSYDSRAGGDRGGFTAGINAATAEGRIGQSDTLTLSQDLAGYIPLGDRVLLALHARWSDAHVTKKATKYLDKSAVAGALDPNCAAVAQSGARSRCEEFAGELAAYIAENNRHGTAVPLGGSRGVRSQEELGLRAAHTRLFSTEIHWLIWRGADLSAELAPLVDVGWSDDSAEEVFRRAVVATGAEFTLHLKELPLRLGYAKAKRDEAWFFTAGRAF